MKNLNPFPFLLIYSLSVLLSSLLWLTRWKARTIRINLAACGLAGKVGPGFLFHWYFNASHYFLRFLLARPDPPIFIRPRDRHKLESLRSGASLLLTGHFHSWEFLASWLNRTGIPILGSARPLASPRAQVFLQRLRTTLGIPVVTRDVLFKAMAHLREGSCFGILWDQFSRQSRHSSPLFGLPAAMDPLPEILVRRSRPRVLVAFLLPSGSLRLFPIHGPGRPLSDPRRLSRRYHRLLETVVRAYPSFWYGLAHARFKDLLSYESPRDVSRETPIRSSTADVSRETWARNTKG